MPFKLSTTIGKIQNIPNSKNIELPIYVKSKFDNNATLDNVIFNYSNLTGAEFIEADVKKIDFEKSLLSGALFNENSFSEAAMLKKNCTTPEYISGFQNSKVENILLGKGLKKSA